MNQIEQFTIIFYIGVFAWLNLSALYQAWKLSTHWFVTIVAGLLAYWIIATNLTLLNAVNFLMEHQ